MAENRPNVNERTYQEVEYLKKNLGPVLVAALAEICIRRPADPIEYLGHWLLRWRYNEELKRRDVQNALEVVRQKQWDAAQAGTVLPNMTQGVTPGYPNLPPGYGSQAQAGMEGEEEVVVETTTEYQVNEEFEGEEQVTEEAIQVTVTQEGKRKSSGGPGTSLGSASLDDGKRASLESGHSSGGPAKEKRASVESKQGVAASAQDVTKGKRASVDSKSSSVDGKRASLSSKRSSRAEEKSGEPSEGKRTSDGSSVVSVPPQ